MKRRHLSASVLGLILLGTGASYLFAQAPIQPSAPADRAAQRAEIVKLRTDAEMLRFDYELARDRFLEDLKIERSLGMMGGMMQIGMSIQSAMTSASQGEAPKPAPAPTPEEKKKADDEAKAAEAEKKKNDAAEAVVIADRKKELARLFALMSAKQLEAETAERDYWRAIESK